MNNRLERVILVVALFLLMATVFSKFLGFTLDDINWTPALKVAVYIAFAWIYLIILFFLISKKTKKEHKIVWLALLVSVIAYSMPILDDDTMQYITYVLAATLVIYAMRQLRNIK